MMEPSHYEFSRIIMAHIVLILKALLSCRFRPNIWAARILSSRSTLGFLIGQTFAFLIFVQFLDLWRIISIFYGSVILLLLSLALSRRLKVVSGKVMISKKWFCLAQKKHLCLNPSSPRFESQHKFSLMNF